MSKDKPIVIAGAGLGGLILAATLWNSGFEVIVSDPGKVKAASQVAAGLFNVITGRFSVPTWKAKELLQALHAFFKMPEMDPLKKHLIQLPVYRPFTDITTLNDWSVKSEEEPYKSFSFYSDQAHPLGIFNDNFGGYTVTQSGWLNMVPFLADLKALLSQKGVLFLPHSVEDDKVNAFENRIELGNTEIGYKKLIYANGVSSLKTSFFDWIPIMPLKGQILEGECPIFPETFIYNGGSFFLPKGKGRILCGSTYERHFDDDLPNEAGKMEILDRLPITLRENFVVTSHLAGIRPATRDRIPVIGKHPLFPDVLIFNGLGAKGVLHSPWMAKELVHSFLHPEYRFEKAYSIERFVKRFFVN